MTLKGLFIIGIGAGLFAGGACAQESLTLRKIKETGIITIGFRDGSIPFSYLDKKRRPIGYSMDICYRIVDAVKAKVKLPNLEVKFTPVNPANRVPLVANDIVDLECGSTTNNAERQQKVAFTVTTFVASGSLVSKKSSNIQSLNDLEGQTVVYTAGTTSIQALTEFNRALGLNMSILTGKDHVESFLMVETDRAAAFAMDDVLLHGLIANAKNPSDFRIHHSGLSVEPYGMVLRKNDPDFKKVADDAIIELFKSGEINQLYRKWFQSPIPPNQINFKLPMSPALRKVIAHPTDSGDPADYR